MACSLEMPHQVTDRVMPSGPGWMIHCGAVKSSLEILLAGCRIEAAQHFGDPTGERPGVGASHAENPPDQGSPTPLPNVFRREGDFWTLTFAGKTIRLKDSLGLQCIAHLLAKQRCELDAALLRAIVSGNIPVKPSAGIEVLDSQAHEHYRADYEDLLFQMEEAEENNDIARQELLQTKIDALAQQLKSAEGFGGRIRKSKDASANARTSLTNAITRAIEHIQKEHDDLSRHLDNSIRTGQSFCYKPETDVDWDL
jgi:hypothetical protein